MNAQKGSAVSKHKGSVQMTKYELRLCPAGKPDEPQPMSQHHSVHDDLGTAAAAGRKHSWDNAYRGFEVVRLGEFPGQIDRTILTESNQLHD